MARRQTRRRAGIGRSQIEAAYARPRVYETGFIDTSGIPPRQSAGRCSPPLHPLQPAAVLTSAYTRPCSQPHSPTFPPLSSIRARHGCDTFATPCNGRCARWRRCSPRKGRAVRLCRCCASWPSKPPANFSFSFLTFLQLPRLQRNLCNFCTRPSASDSRRVRPETFAFSR